ncbi:MAG: ABC transporter ATP-binding protein [Candidatus Omnitrophica bacterium CG08_land_8_20_14_0_20_41_16]|uniref:ABC transporter ATP-binding protein n=1 Tax=Candidatus Sherwoodlollariibacterium unditelluris TaxID=1974757 RepID=A0A2G9YHW5_9BACT|nr:MAG: ABC transporter ATP-binding protein [Candidatus Omnitrophica bacterium CG23_combo_of_CG06-09_8_20_14_all_41_10]PIS34409.1 MAG: ABC transporter ATP-binding protein [Candidatus Omnitrophica bacterium CG08_land_8_20_14_0_20_41_16]
MIEILGVEKNFNGNIVLRGVDLKIDRGSTCVIIGRSGCGKSVLLKHIVGILKPDKGKIIINSKDIVHLSEEDLNALRLKIGMVFQGGALFDSMTVGENVGFGLIEHNHTSDKELRETIEESLSLVGLSGIASLMPSDLSGGMKKRVALARALCIKPEIILYDEPTTGVDPISADSINELIKNLHDKLNVTSIVVTHDMKSAYRVGDKLAMLYQGKIIAQGSPNEIQKTEDPIVHQFINGLAHGPITET